MEHVKSVEIDYSSCHCVISKAHFCSSVNNKSSSFFPITRLGFKINPITNRGCVPFQILFVIIPARHDSNVKALHVTKDIINLGAKQQHTIRQLSYILTPAYTSSPLVVKSCKGIVRLNQYYMLVASMILDALVCQLEIKNDNQFRWTKRYKKWKDAR